MVATTTAAARPARTRSARPDPGDSEARFGIEELFFSTTDRRGRIVSGNRVFARTSGYDLEELRGQPHSVVRHPDMPRAAFRILWRELDEDRPVAAYVKNLAKDGSYYWVLAFVVPADVGFLSIRLKPTSELFAGVQALYREMVAVEREHEDGTREGREAGMQASEALLLERLAALGLDGYHPFMRTALVQEVAARDDALGRRAPRDETGTSAGADEVLQQAYRVCWQLLLALADLVGSVRGLAEQSGRLEQRSRFIRSLSETIRVSSLNALLAASHLGPEGAAIGAVASLMRDRSDAIGPVIHDLAGGFLEALTALEDLAFRAAAGRLQTEMSTVFIRELLSGGGGDGVERDLEVLATCLDVGVERVFTTLADLESRIGVLLRGITRLERDLEGIRALEVNGRVEGARLDGTSGAAIAALFASIRDRISEAGGEIDGLRASARSLVEHDADLEAGIRDHVSELCRHVTGLLSSPVRERPTSATRT